MEGLYYLCSENKVADQLRSYAKRWFFDDTAQMLNYFHYSTQKRTGRPRKTWDKVFVNDRKKLGM